MPFPAGPLLLASFLAVCESVLVCAAGAALARYGVLTPAARHALSKLGFYVLLPAITFVKVAEAVDASTIADFWPLLANAALSVALGAALGAVAARAVAPPPLRRATMVACAVGNVSIIPLLVVVSLCSCGDGLALTRALGTECTTRGVAYVAVGGAVASVLHHVVGYHGMKPRGEGGEGGAADDDGDGDGDGEEWPPSAACGACGAPAPAPSSADGAPTPRRHHHPLSPAPSSDDDVGGELCELDTLFQAAARLAAGTPGARRRRRESAAAGGGFAAGLPRTASLAAAAWGHAASRPGSAATVWRARRHSAPEGGCEDGGGGAATPRAARLPPLPLPPPATTTRPPRPHPLRRLLSAAWAAVRAVESILPLPALLSLSGLVVGCVPPLKRVLFGPAAPLEFVAHALHTVAGATVPIMSFILGAALHRGPGGRRVVRPRLVAAVVAVRLVALPLLGGAVVLGTGVAGLWEALDPLFVFVLILINAAPTAPAVQALASMFRANEAETAALIFWQYVAYVVALPPLIAGAAAVIEAAPLRWRAGQVTLAPTNDPGMVR